LRAQVNEASWNTGTSSVDIGLIIKHYTYDGHGRLIRIMSPFPDPWTMTVDDFRTERLYYDGIRRIQEVVVDPVQGNSNGQSSEEEEGQIGGGTAAEHLEREYVWGPGDNGFDELLVQYDSAGAAWWAIMDAGGDLVALCDLNGSGSAARVVGQWTYDAYGAVLSADILGNRITSRLTQAPVGVVSQDNIFSQLNSYDTLNRLVKTEYGTLRFTGGGSPPAPVISPVVRTDEWSLDLLGNWIGGAAAGTTGPPEGRIIAGDLDWGGGVQPGATGPTRPRSAGSSSAIRTPRR
jgi:hypothetical protein